MAGQQERQASRAAMAGRQNGKRKWNEVELEGVYSGHKFCTVFSATESAERLRIPPPFSQYLENQPTGLVFLKGQSGNKWLVQLASDSEGLFFGHRWKEFVGDHSIETGHILTFCYDGCSQFSVVVFDGMCIEKPSAFHAKPSKEISDDTEEEYMSASPNSTKEPDSSHRVLEESIPPKDSSKSSPMFRLSKDVDISGVISVVKVQRGTEVMSQRQPVSVAVPESDEEDKQISVAPQEENTGTKTKRTREIDPNSSSLRKSSNGASVGYESASLNRTKVSDSSNRVLEESIARRNSSKSITMLRFSKDVDICGKTIAKVQRQPAIRSQRPPVSEEQKNYALQKAKQYKSKYPITLQIMKETFVYKTFFMIIPCEFVREHLPHTEQKLTLWDPQGKAWEVTYVYCSQRRHGAFSGGWGKFSVGNHLEEFDVCVFELLSKDNIKVHIYRANLTLYEFLLDSSN